jgi:hypothetical protein
MYEVMDGIVDLRFDSRELAKTTKEDSALKRLRDGFVNTDQAQEIISANYPPMMSFYNHFEKKGGVAKIIKVAMESMALWKNKKLADSWGMWLKELESFSQVDMFF